MGGKINIAGKNIALSNTAIIDASGKQQGGQVLIGDKQNTQQTSLAQGSTINANTTNSGNAGNIAVFANMDNGQVNVQGTINATASKQGNGGFVETSAAKVKVADSAKITTTAKQGTTAATPNLNTIFL